MGIHYALGEVVVELWICIAEIIVRSEIVVLLFGYLNQTLGYVVVLVDQLLQTSVLHLGNLEDQIASFLPRILVICSGTVNGDRQPETLMWILDQQLCQNGLKQYSEKKQENIP